MTGSGAFCGVLASTIDSSMPMIDGPRPDTAPGCFGVGVVHDVCLMPQPTTDLMISADRAVNTAMVGGTNCDTIIAQPGGGASLCLIAAKTISIAATAKVTAIGANPLLLIASDAINVAGTIDVASRLSMMPGAGADTTCASPDGADNLTFNNGQGGGGGGGGAGGSFGTAGGNGGAGRSFDGKPNPPGGQAPGPIAPTSLRGGCAGGAGGEADGGQGNGNGGGGGGAVALIAGSSLTIAGIINASGSGGAQGTDGVYASGGAGGGGAGGMITLDAPTIAVTGQVFANGGGGGGGGGNDPANHGQPGNTASTALTAATGGNGGSGGGGRGGDGFGGTNNAANGANATNSGFCAGGGGGGGAGIIRVYGPAPSSLGGMISPPAT